jgi:hypothetical protein
MIDESVIYGLELGHWYLFRNAHSEKTGKLCNIHCLARGGLSFLNIDWLHLRGTQDGSRYFDDLTHIELIDEAHPMFKPYMKNKGLPTGEAWD